MLEGNLAIDWHPIQGGGGSDTPHQLMLGKPGYALAK